MKRFFIPTSPANELKSLSAREVDLLKGGFFVTLSVLEVGLLHFKNFFDISMLRSFGS